MMAGSSWAGERSESWGYSLVQSSRCYGHETLKLRAPSEVRTTEMESM